MVENALRCIEQADVAGKRVLVRVDLNVPMQGGVITDTTRIERVLPTIELLVKRGARVVILSHFGRPRGKPNADMSLKPVADAMRAWLGGTGMRISEMARGPRIAGHHRPYALNTN